MKGYELIEKIVKDEVKEGSKFLFRNFRFDTGFLEIPVIWKEDCFQVLDVNSAMKCEIEYLTDKIYDVDLFLGDFEPINEKINIDIQAIEELDKTNSETMNEATISDKVNELIKAVKQLDKK